MSKPTFNEILCYCKKSPFMCTILYSFTIGSNTYGQEPISSWIINEIAILTEMLHCALFTFYADSNYTKM